MSIKYHILMSKFNIRDYIGAISLPVYILAWSISDKNANSISEKYSLFTGT